MRMSPSSHEDGYPAVIPAKAGIHVRANDLDSRFRGNDDERM
jgi:hypothetical protein